ncbi:MAG: hypothetical protein ACK58T_25905, partial [Phycisphaerae bacterium]
MAYATHPETISYASLRAERILDYLNPATGLTRDCCLDAQSMPQGGEASLSHNTDRQPYKQSARSHCILVDQRSVSTPEDSADS